MRKMARVLVCVALLCSAKAVWAQQAVRVYGNDGQPAPLAIDFVGTAATLASVGDPATIRAQGLQTFGVTVAAGTFIGTLNAYCSMDGGSTWTPDYFDLADTSKALTLPVNLAAVQASIMPMGGCSHYKVQVATATSGTTTAALRGTMALDLNSLFSAPNGSTNLPPSNAVIAGLSSSTNAIKTVAVTSTGGVLVQSSPSPGLPLMPCNPVRSYNCQPKGF